MTSQLPNDRKLKALGTSKLKSSNIGLTEEDKPMLLDGGSLRVEVSSSDLDYIRNAIASGIANYIVEKVSKNAENSVDKAEPERYLPNTNEKECDHQ